MNNIIQTPREYHINPKKINTITRSINIDSIFRKNYDNTKSTDFTYILPQPLTNVLSMKLTSLELPNMSYSFSNSELSNRFTIHCYNIPVLNIDDTLSFDNPYDESYEVVIPEGNYIAPNFAEMLNNYFVNSGGGLFFIHYAVNEFNTNSIFRTVHDEDVDGKDPYAGNITDKNFYFTIDFDIPGLPLYKTAGWNLGFRNHSYTVTKDMEYNDITTANTILNYKSYLSSESSFGSSILQYVFLSIDDFQRNSVSDSTISMFQNSLLSDNIIARITLTSGQNTIVIDDSSDMKFKKRKYFGPTRIDKLHIKLLNRYGDILNINKNDISFSLEIEQDYSNN